MKKKLAMNILAILIMLNLTCVPSSGIRTLTTVLYGPLPTLVDAAIVHAYVVYGVRFVSVRFVAFVMYSFVSPVTTMVCLMVYIVTIPF